ncbi:HaeIII family restriction endonuclease [Lonepinella sp. MS14437]|uniref:HaeIII family restriction endonuclease n=2 Tax=unclassified Lonepinella TaxID=2642006 RepID=UPI0036D9E3BC
MSSKSNDQGRAYEFAYILMLEQELKNANIIVNVDKANGFQAAKKSWQLLDPLMQSLYQKSALAGVNLIFELEPLILENKPVTLCIQTDNKGEQGDVRDILISRDDIAWMIGLSVKHNHFAVKHSRLSPNIDFAQKWFNLSCSANYWQAAKPIFERLKELKNKGVKWRELDNKESHIYAPLLRAFIDEINHQYHHQGSLVPTKMVEYLLGEFDFYKAISVDKKQLTTIQSFNLRGTLNQPSKKAQAKMIVPIVHLPTRIFHCDFKPDSNNTVEMILDEGWQFSFRIHNASTKVEPSLKFDIQFIGMPTAIVSIDCKWQ